MHGVKLVISDGHSGLGAARRAVLGSAPWQRCQPVLDGQSRVPLAAKSWGVCAQTGDANGSGGRYRSQVNAPDRKTAEEFLQAVIQKNTVSAPKLST